MPEIKTQDLQTSANTLASPTPDLTTADPNFTNPVPSTDLPINQAANQGVPPEEIPSVNLTPIDDKQDQTAVFGKSELLNAHQILTQMLNLKIGNRVADLGAGGGLFTLQAARLVGDQGEIYAVDIMKSMLSDIESKARMANLYNIKTVWSNIEILGATKIPEDTLDFVLLINILFQSQATDKMLNEAARLLKSGGKMLIIDWSAANTGMGPKDDKQIDPNNIINQAKSTNLVLEQQFVAGQYHFGLIFIKP